jgi:hypothetical protein
MSHTPQRLAPHIPQLLKETRTARALTLEMVHRRTKIPVGALCALEENDPSYFSAPVYMHGFLEQYCEYLELDYARLTAPQPEPETPAVEENAAMPRQSETASGNEIPPGKTAPLPEPQELFSAAPEHQPKANSRRETQTKKSEHKQAPAPSYSLDGFEEHVPKETSFASGPALGFEDFQSSMNGNIMRMLLVSIIGCAVCVAWLWRNASSYSQAEQATQERNIQQYNQLYESTFVSTLKASFSRKTWLRVDADGSVVFEGFAQEGDTHEWKASRDFDVRTQTPSAMVMTIDNKPIRPEIFSSSHTVIPVTFTGGAL